VKQGTKTTTTDYQGIFHYQNGYLQFLATAQGYANWNSGLRVNQKNTSENNLSFFNYVYNYTDHLGNIRLSYTTSNRGINSPPIVLEENHYYPFGLKHQKYDTTNKDFVLVNEETGDGYYVGIENVPPKYHKPYQYKFQGQEYQPELDLNMYDFGARNYDPALGRWLTIDPLAELSCRWSPYNYAYSNPVYFIDPDGMQALDFDIPKEDDPPLGFPQEHGKTHTDDIGSWMYDKPTDTWIGQNGSPSIENVQKMETVEITNNRESNNNGGYFESYFKDYFNYKRPAHANAYSPYIPSGQGFTLSGSIGGFSASVSFAVNKKNETDLFFSLDGKFRLHNIFSKPWSVSATFDIYNNNGKTGNIFDNIEGQYRTISGGMIFSGAYSYPIRNGKIDEQGVTKTSFGFGSPSAGFGGGKTWRLFGKEK